MMTLALLLAVPTQTAQPPAPRAVPNGTHLRVGAVCYAIVQNGSSIGATLQTIRKVRVEGKRAWDIVVHQRITAMQFDMRDHFIVARADLRPIAFDSRKGSEGAKGWHRIDLRYAKDRIVGTRIDTDGTHTIDVALHGPVWEGNLWGVTFGALPLAEGARFTLPYWQYDKGFGSYTVNVIGRDSVETPTGRVDAWIAEAGADPSQLASYRLAKRDGAELGYGAGGFEQRLGGDCAGLD